MTRHRPAWLHLRQQLRLHLPRVRRYLSPVLRHGTPRKLANMLLAEAELRLGRTVLRAHPYYYLIDICNVCNLRCPLCPTGNDSVARTQGIMRFEEYRQILDKVKRYALVVSLYNHGEPLLNKDIFKIIEYTARNNVATNVSSNFNWPIPVDPKDIVRSGLEYITVSLDGVSQESYQQYRVGELVAQWGVDLLRFVAPGIQPESMDDRNLREKWMPEDPLFSERNPADAVERGYIYDRTCFYLYRSMSIYYGGGVTPCCFTHDRKHDFGDILKSSVEDIWTNRHYRSARLLFNNRQPREERSPVVCDLCPIFHQARDRSCNTPGRSFGADHTGHAAAHAGAAR